MQDIRKPYTRSKSNSNLSSRVEKFESRSYDRDDEDVRPVHIPIKVSRGRRNIHQMEMYPRKLRDEEIDDDYEEDRPRGDIVYRDPRTRYRGANNSFSTWATVSVVGVLVGGALLLTYVFNSATITLVPKHQDVEGLHKTISFTSNVADSVRVPFVIATSTITKSKTLPLSETKKVQAKASGTIVIYNNFDAEPQKLIKNTRFESLSGKIYRINQSIIVPGKKADTPGSVEAIVYADSYGADYNSAPTDFTIPGFKGTPRYTGFFGRSNGAITGGASGNMTLASLADVNAAKDELALETAQKLKTDLSTMKKDGYVGLYSAVDVVYKDNEQDVLQGITSTYEVTATGYLMFASAPEFSKKIAEGVRDYNGEPVRLSYTDTLNYSRKDTDRIATAQNIDILVEGSPRVIWNTDQEAIKILVAGKKRDEFKPLMKSIDSIESAEISFSPLWLSSFPADKTKISIVESLPKR